MAVNMFVVIFLSLTFQTCFAINSQRVEFIKSFIENEQKPTHLMFQLCWGHKAELDLVKQMNKIGVRSSRSHEPAVYLDQGLLFLMDLECPIAGDIIDKATSRFLFGMPYRWLVLTNTSEYEARVILEKVPLLADSDLVLAVEIEYGFRMIELHKPAPQAALVSTIRGYYNGNLTDVRPHRSLFRRRRDLRRNPVTMSVVLQDSNSTHEHLEDRLEPQFDYITKISWLNARLGFEMLNSTPKHIWTYRWGYFVNGSWSGMIEDMRTGKADVGCNCMIKHDRLNVVAYTDNLAPFRVGFVLRQPPLSYVTNIFKLPFSSGVWIALFICTIASSLGVWAATHWEAKFSSSPSQLDGNFSDALLLTMGALSQQGCALEPNKASGRIMALMMLVTLMAMYAAYSANIVVLLQAPSTSIRTLAQLGASKLTLAANDVDYSYFILSQYPNDSLRVKIFKKIDGDKGKKQYYHIEEGVQRIRQGLFAFHSIVEPIYRRIEDTFQENEKCDLAEVDFTGDSGGFIPVTKNSSYLELLRVVFKQVQESGIKQAVVRRQQTPKPKCAHKGAMFSSVGLRDLMPVIILMLYGTGCSIIILLVEIILHKLIQRRMDKPNFKLLQQNNREGVNTIGRENTA